MTNYKINGTDLILEKNNHNLLGPITFELLNSSCIIILGQNGAGKTSFLRLLHGLDKPKSGLLTWDPYIGLEEQSFIFQSPVILKRSVLENVVYPLLLRGVSRTDSVFKAEHWLEKTSLIHKANEPALSLSGGEKQRMVIARSLICSPKLLFLDEPTVNLDGESKLTIENLLKQVINEGTKIIMATHDLGQVKRLGGDIVFLHHGKIVEIGSVALFFNKPKTDAAFKFLQGEILQ